MTCHSIKIIFDGTVSELDAESAIDNVLTTYNSVVPEQSSPSTEDNVTYRNTEIDNTGTDYHYCLYRFGHNQSKSNIISDIEAELNSISVNWFQIESHECYHNDTSGGACGDWQIESTVGTVPNGV